METAIRRAASKPGPGAGDGVLVDPQWLHDHLADPRVRVVEVDVSPAAYDDWHIDGAVLWNIYGDLKDADYRPSGPPRWNGYWPAPGSARTRRSCSTGTRPPGLLADEALRSSPTCASSTAPATPGGPKATRGAAPRPAAAGRLPPGRRGPRIRADRAAVHDAIGRAGHDLLTCARRPSTGRALLAVGRHGTGWPRRSRAFGRPSAHRRPLRRATGRSAPPRSCASCSPRSILDGDGGADHLLHHRRPRRHRLVRAHLPARPRPRPGLRRVMGRVGPHSRHPGRVPMNDAGRTVACRSGILLRCCCLCLPRCRAAAPRFGYEPDPLRLAVGAARR